LDNKAAVLADIKVYTPTIRDALSELEQLKEAQTGQSEDGSDDPDDPLSSPSDKLSSEEAEILPGAIQMVKLSFMFIQRLEKIISMSNNDGNERQYGIWLSDLRQKVHEIGEAVDNFCVGLYPPQVRQDLHENFTKLKQVILTTLPILGTNTVSQQDNVKKLLEMIYEKISSGELLINPK